MFMGVLLSYMKLESADRIDMFYVDALVALSKKYDCRI